MKISAGLILSYLLEQSRIVSAPPGERNYHVFYYMIAGMPEPLRSQLHLEDSPADPRAPALDAARRRALRPLCGLRLAHHHSPFLFIFRHLQNRQVSGRKG